MVERIRRIGSDVVEYGLTVVAALTVNFALPHLAPGDPLRYVIGQAASDLSATERTQLLATYGLDKPLHVQYVDYLAGIARGDLGTSVMFGRPVSRVLVDHLPSTILLVGLALVISTLAGTFLGAWSAWNEGTRTDGALLAALVAANSAPAFWVGMLFVSVFAFRLGWFPSYGIAAIDAPDGVIETLVTRGVHLVLPLATLALARVGGIYLVARGSVLTTTGADFIRFERAKGLSERTILFRHVLPNSLLPIYTRFTLQLGTLVGGAVVVETVFSYPGLGLLIYDAALARDYPLLQGAFLVLTITVIGANVLADLTYPFVDPRAGPNRGEGGAR